MRRAPFSPTLRARSRSLKAWRPGALHAALYLKRLIKSDPDMAAYSLEVIFKIFQSDADHLVKALINLMPMAKQRKLKIKIKEEFLDEDDLAKIFLETCFAENETKRKAVQEVKNFLKNHCPRAGDKRQNPLKAAVKTVGAMLQLRPAEKALCQFVYTLEENEALKDFFCDSLHCHRPHRRELLATLLGVSVKELEEALGGTVFRFEFLSIDQYGMDMSQEFLHILENPSVQVLREHFQPIEAEPVPLEAHLVGEDVVHHVLALLAVKRDFPINILLYGPPGTGKTSFAKALVNTLKVPGYLVQTSHENKGEKRRFSIATSLAAVNGGHGAILVVDDADDLLNTERLFLWFTSSSQDKSWLNHILDTPGIRTIWICNTVSGIHDAVRRRFTYSIAFRSFGPDQRKRLWKSVLQGNCAQHLLPEEHIEKIARRFTVNTGPMDTAVKGALAVAENSPEAFRKALTLGLSAYMVLENDGEPFREAPSVQENFLLEGLSVKGDLQGLLDHIERVHAYLKDNPGATASTTALFYGPPGAGKTELGRYIAHRLEKELMVVGSSNLLSPFVGETEMNIRETFEKASSNEAVLMIDEIDSLLFSRSRAHYSWEVGMTNTMLTALENFRGLFIGTTNRLQDLDEAVLRRFHHKIEFSFLSTEGKRLFYERFFATLAEAPMDESCLKTLERMSELTPGDFRAVWERYRFGSHRVGHEELLEALRHEVELKHRHHGAGRAGF